jgi:Protein of unknown function (DUF3180)
MTPARIRTAALIVLVTTAVGFVGLDTWTGSGHNPPPMGWAAVAGTVTLIVLLIGAGLQVRRWIGGKAPRRVDALTAARVAVLAKAGAYAGAGLVGWYLSQALDIYPDLVGVRRTHFIVALVAAASAVVLSAAGFAVQRWCRVPPRDDDGAGNGDDAQRDQVP